MGNRDAAELAISCRGLTRDYGQGRGIFDLDLEVRRGEEFGFVGENGAGKTTTIRLLMDLIRGREVNDALNLLRFAKQRSSGMIEKVIKSAVANASEQEAGTGDLYVARAWVDPGPVIKRFQPKDRGKAYSIKKRTSHLVVTVDERED